jgi:hypothetical protein
MHTGDEHTTGQLWLPSGQNASLDAPSKPGEWRQVVLELDWDDMTLGCFLDGACEVMLGSRIATVLRRRACTFPCCDRRWRRRSRCIPTSRQPATRVSLADTIRRNNAFCNDWLQANGLPAREVEQLRAESTSGFRNMYLFTWLERPEADDVPEVHVSDLFFEDEAVSQQTAGEQGGAGSDAQVEAPHEGWGDETDGSEDDEDAVWESSSGEGAPGAAGDDAASISSDD